MRKAFTMMELIFVIAIIGILAAIAVPKFSATRDDAIITKAKTTVANIRSALSTEIQKKILKADYSAITDVGGVINAHDKEIFDYFNSDNKNGRVLDYPLRSCKSASSRGCWMRTGKSTYKYYLPNGIGGDVIFRVNNGRFECDYNHNANGCRMLER